MKKNLSMITRKEFEEAVNSLIKESVKPRYIPWWMKLSEKEIMDYMDLVNKENERNRDKYTENT